MRSLLLPLLRRSVVAFAVAQVVMVAVTPVHVEQTAGESNAARVEALHHHPGVPHHDPDSCPICQLVSTPLLRPEVTRVVPLGERVVQPASVAVALPAARGPPSAHQTRAPPLLA